MIDHVVILNKGGQLSFSGDSKRALQLFNEIWTNPYSLGECTECPHCGSVNPNLLMEAQHDESDACWHLIRKISEGFTSQMSSFAELAGRQVKEGVPQTKTLPVLQKLRQLRVQLKRQFVCKLRDTTNRIITFVVPPVLGVLSALSFRHSPVGTSYSFELNIHFYQFLFLSTVIGMFFGVSNSITDIIKDRGMLMRDGLKKISIGSYFFAKVLVLLFFALIQCFLFVFISHRVLQVDAMLVQHTVGMLLVTAVGIGFGLLCSAFTRSVCAAYNLVPLILIPQIVLGGGFLPFSEIGNSLFMWEKDRQRPPPVAQLMPTRWGFEMLVTSRYRQTHDAYRHVIDHSLPLLDKERRAAQQKAKDDLEAQGTREGWFEIQDKIRDEFNVRKQNCIDRSTS